MKPSKCHRAPHVLLVSKRFNEVSNIIEKTKDKGYPSMTYTQQKKNTQKANEQCFYCCSSYQSQKCVF